MLLQTLLFCLLSLMPANAKANFASDFAASVQKELFWFEPSRLLHVSGRISLAKPSLLEQWGWINADAAATYNSWLRTIVLKPESIRKRATGELRLATIGELRESQETSMGPTVSTIFHELAHAEFDLLVKAGATPADHALRRTLDEEVAPWLAKAHPELSYFSRQIAVSEIFGYFHGDFVQFLLSERDDILLENGFAAGRCFFPSWVKAAALGLSVDDFSKLIAFEADAATSFEEHFQLSYIWIKGKDVDLAAATSAGPFQRRWNQALYHHFRSSYGLPGSKLELVQRMNRQLPERFKECRREYWLKVRL